MKICAKCKEEKPLAEFHFHKSGRKAGKPRSRCRKCNNQDTEFYKKRRLASDPTYRQSLNEKARPRQRKWQSQNKSKRAEWQRLRRAATGGRYEAEWRSKNREYLRERMRLILREARPSYIRALIRNGTILVSKDIPDSLIRVKTKLLKLKRYARSKENLLR